MSILGFFLGVLASVMVYWLFIKGNSLKKWYTCVLAVAFIAWSVFSADFVLTSAIEGMPQAAAIAALLFGSVEIILFVLLFKFSGPALLPGRKAAEVSGR